jgi:hypothetical protein
MAALPDGFTLVPHLFDATASVEGLTGLRAELDWEQQQFTISGRATPMPRLIAMYGPVGYRYSGVVHPPRPLPARLDAIRRRVEAATGRRFNWSRTSIATGATRSAGTATTTPTAACRTRVGELRRDAPVRPARPRARASIEFRGGQPAPLTGDAVARWWHRVPRTSRPVGPRVNHLPAWSRREPAGAGDTRCSSGGGGRPVAPSADAPRAAPSRATNA